MKITRLDLDGAASPTKLAQRIHEIEDLPMAVPLEALCNALDIHTIKEIDVSQFEAALVTDSVKSSGDILLNQASPRHRKRFSIAHELGHFLIEAHRPRPGQPMECSLDNLLLLNPRDKDRRRRIEAEANRFASHLLMPPDRIRSFVGRQGASLETIVSMAAQFDVSKEAMARAFVEAHREPVAIIVGRQGKALRFYRSEDFPFLPFGKGLPFPAGSLSADPLPPGEFSEVEEIEPNEWFEDDTAETVLALSEQVLGQAKGYSLTLLQAELDEDA